MNLHTLILEDFPEHAMKIVALLNELGITHDKARNVVEATTILENPNIKEPDFAIIDITLGNDAFGGIRFAKKLKNEYPHIPFFFLTQHYRDESISKKVEEDTGIDLENELYIYFNKSSINERDKLVDFIESFIQINFYGELGSLALSSEGFLIQKNNGYEFVKIDSVLYLKSVEKKTDLILLNEESDISLSRHLKPIAKQFLDTFPYFLKLGTKYCINAKQIKRVEKTEAKDSKGKTIYNLIFIDNISEIDLNYSEYRDLEKSGLFLKIRKDR